jgi:cation transport regulator ChaB
MMQRRGRRKKNAESARLVGFFFFSLTSLPDAKRWGEKMKASSTNPPRATERRTETVRVINIKGIDEQALLLSQVPQSCDKETRERDRDRERTALVAAWIGVESKPQNTYTERWLGNKQNNPSPLDL